MKIIRKLMHTSFISIILLLFYITFNIDLKSASTFQNKVQTVEENQAKSTTTTNSRNKDLNDKENLTDLKYILQWTPSNGVPFMFMGKGRQGFIDKKCPYTNCFVTDNRSYFGKDVTKFDVVAFNAPQFIRLGEGKLPAKRAPHQKYVFVSIESSDYYPVCSDRFDGYFNWTWTFKLDSEVKWGYMVIRDRYGEVVGPKKNMNWIKFEDMDPVSDKLKQKLKTKSKAAAWFVSNCSSKSRREKVVKDLQNALKKFDLTVDVYGKCGPLKCDQGDEAACFNLIKEKYYFYLSFENSFSEDYVTEKLLNAVQNNAIPIVYGAANYTRFLPEHSYLNAKELSADDLAAKMDRLIKYTDEYYEYFRWTKYYSYHRPIDSVETDEHCLFCSILNDEKMVKVNSVHNNFREWWNPPGRCR